ncbi:MAG: redox-sensing transcriptional repressor Rex [Bacteroidales bacterium]|nr:redox-sensing transcriptional repressor Rex [Bacteroidales bacterium]
MLPGKTVERLSKYRRFLQDMEQKGLENIFSHEIGSNLQLTPVQVRRDIMLIGYTGSQRKGYVITDLICKIDEVLNPKSKYNAAIFGIGNLGKAITSYFNHRGHNISIVAAFDCDQQKTGRVISGVWCYDLNYIKEIIKEQKITLAILTLPYEHAQEITDRLVQAGIKGILNFTSSALKVPEHVYIESYDMITSLEKLAYYVKKTNN